MNINFVKNDHKIIHYQPMKSNIFNKVEFYIGLENTCNF